MPTGIRRSVSILLVSFSPLFHKTSQIYTFFLQCHLSFGMFSASERKIHTKVSKKSNGQRQAPTRMPPHHGRGEHASMLHSYGSFPLSRFLPINSAAHQKPLNFSFSFKYRRSNLLIFIFVCGFPTITTLLDSSNKKA